MESSQYVVNAIVSIDNVEKDRDQHAISLIKESAERAENELDAHILNVISGSMTMTHKNKGQQFSHYLIIRKFLPTFVTLLSSHS